MFKKFLDFNIENIKNKLLIFEDFRQNEDSLKEYYSAAANLDKSQLDLKLFKFEKQYQTLLDDVLDFNPNDIKKEVLKCNNHNSGLQSFKDELTKIYEQLNGIELSWSKFLEKHPSIKESFFEEVFKKEYLITVNLISKVDYTQLSSVYYQLEILSKTNLKIISIIDVIYRYLSDNIFIGKEALEIKDELEGMLKITEFSSINDFQLKWDLLQKRINLLKENSLLATVGFPVYEVSFEHIKKYTIKIKDKLLKHDPFFNNNSLQNKKTGSYFYVDNFPKYGIFKGADIVNGVDISSDYYDAVSDIKEESDNIFKTGVITFITLSLLFVFFAKPFLSFLLLFLFVGFLAAQPRIINAIISKAERKYELDNIFLIVSIDTVFFKFGENIELKLLLRQMIKDFNMVFENQDFKEGEEILWQRTYPLVKNQLQI